MAPEQGTSTVSTSSRSDLTGIGRWKNIQPRNPAVRRWFQCSWVLTVSLFTGSHVLESDLRWVLAIETGFILWHHPDIVRAPDVASVAGGRRGTDETPAGFLEWAELIGMNPNSISNYARTGELPTHLALIAVLIVVISEMGGDCRRIMSRVERVRKQPRGSARGGLFGGGR